MNDKKGGSPVEITALSNELIYRRYLFNKERAGKFPRELSRPEYIALNIIRNSEGNQGNCHDKIYLKEIAGQMRLPARKLSEMVRKLKERGFLNWSHDGDGSEGTYVTLTESGRVLLAKEEEHLKDYYGHVIEKFGEDNLRQMLQLMKQLEMIMNGSMEGLEDDEIDRQAE